MNKVPIILFTVDGCPYCEEGRLFLRGLGVDYIDRNVLSDAEALQDMLYLMGRSDVPALYAGYQASIGFDPPRWREVLAHARDVEQEDPFRLPPMFGPDPLKL